MRSERLPNTVDRGHLIRLDPTVAKAKVLARACGVSRFTYNWALAEWEKQYKAGGKPTAAKLRKQFNAIKGEQFPWIYDSPRDANSQPFADLGQAFSNFFASCTGKRKGHKVKHPKFRKRGVDDSFYVANYLFKVRQRGKRGVVRLPVIGDVRMMEPLRWQGKILNARVFRKANQWFIAITVETAVKKPHVHDGAIVGVDLGLKPAVIPSHGDSIEAPKPIKSAVKVLKRAQRQLSRRKKGSKNRNKSRIKLAKIHQRIANIRKDFWHKVSTDLVRENQTVVIEDLRQGFMLRNRSLARTASDVGLGMLREMIKYKSLVYGTEVIVADRFYPSTQRCPCCGNIKTGDNKLKLGDNIYKCNKCTYTGDRNLTAALNLEQYPRLEGNWSHKTQTSMENSASTCESQDLQASRIVEVETRL